MFRLRRYRVFLVFALIVIGLFYHFRSIDHIQNAGAASVEGLRHFGQKVESATKKEKDTASGGHNDRFNGLVAAASLVRSGSAASQASTAKSQAAIPHASESAKLSSGIKDTSNKSGTVSKSNGTVPQPRPVNRTGSRIGEKLDYSTTNSLDHRSSGKPDWTLEPDKGPADPVIDEGGWKGPLEVIEDKTIPKIHWSQLPEHFPVPTESLIDLPTGKPLAIPRVQSDFSAEKSNGELEQKDKLDAVRKTFMFSWAGYREKAWMQDELSPESGKYRNPFCGWGATLVDSLDTLWILDLKDEFGEAVEAVGQIDFTTSMRNDIPLFETVIRYLGGLLGAYDISDGTWKVLLDKAVELAEILMGAFDTPNRMPMTFYLWKPTFASQPHRAKTRVVLAELGTLSLEFTRLAQITKDTKYYDAIARITNEFEIWQSHTKLPGLWPLRVDASGCKKAAQGSSTFSQTKEKESKTEGKLTLPEKAAANRAAAANPSIMDADDDSKSDQNPERKSPKVHSGRELLPGDRHSDSMASLDTSHEDAAATRNHHEPEIASAWIHKRDDYAAPVRTSSPQISETTEEKSNCEPQGLASPPSSTTEEFSLGGMADSTYEYLPKEYLLLGGLEGKYRSMYEMAADASKKYLIYRPMIADEKRSILQAGLLKSTGKETSVHSSNFVPEGTHLTCFSGGMFALGAKVFERKEDMDIASKLTDGCVWAYEVTKTGIMPETYLSIPCKRTESCPWNETLWRDKLEPHGSQIEIHRLQQQDQQVLGEEAKPEVERKENAAEQAVRDKSRNLTYASSSAKKDAPDEGSKHEEHRQSEAEDDVADANGKAKSSPPGAESKSLEGKLFQDTDIPQEVPLPKHGQTKPKSNDVKKPKDEWRPKEPLRKRQLGEVDDKPAGPSGNTGDESFALAKQMPDVDKKGQAPLREGSNKDGQSQRAPDVDYSSQKAPNDADESNKVAPGEKQSSSQAWKNTQQNRGNPPSPVITSAKPAAEPPSMKLNSTQSASQALESSLPTREEFIDARIKNEGLPLGMTKVTGTRYLLRPEAIESVFIMYRVTGDKYWRKQGWEMFKAVERHTNSTYGASAIADVTKENPKRLDQMESFWLAETLKYFYLLFSDPSVVSLDEYVLNTEAHPFKRPAKT